MFKKIAGIMMVLVMMVAGVFAIAEELPVAMTEDVEFVEEAPVFAYIGGFYHYEDEASDEVHSNGTAAMMYAEPDVESEKIILLPKNSRVRVIEEDVMFYKVEYTLVDDVYTGWVEGRYIVDEPTYCYEKAIIVVPKGLYLREEPSKKSKAVILMPNETEIVVIYYMNGWARVDAYIGDSIYCGYAYINGTRLKGADGFVLNDEGEIIGYNVNSHIAPRPTAPLSEDDACDDSADDIADPV